MGASEPIVSAVKAGKASAAVTPSDSSELNPMRALYVGTGGTIVGRLRTDTDDTTFENVPDGTLLPFDFKLIKSSGTDADDMVAIR